MAKNSALDLTTGSPIKKILLFSLPLVVGTLFQQLYSFVDTIMVGRLISSDALAAVGTTYPLNFLILGFLQGSCVGFGIPLAQSVGARQPEEFKRFFWSGVWLCAVLAIALTAATTALTRQMLSWLNTPLDILPDAAAYIGIIFLGIPATILYNFCASVLRASGDSQRPTYFLLASSFLNIALDYVFLVPLQMGVEGAALATVLSQLCSGLMNLIWILWKTDLLKESSGLRRFSARHGTRLCRIAFPMGFEYTVAALGTVVMQSAINALGTAVVAGQTAGEKIRQMFTLPMESVGMGMATYVGQNDGAKRYDRIRRGIRDGVALQLGYCAAAWIVIFLGKRMFTALVLGPDAGYAGDISVQYLSIMSLLFCLHGTLMIMRNTLQGMGYSIYTIVSGIGELIGRSVASWLAMGTLGFVGICLAGPCAWLLALVYCSVLVFRFLKRREAQAL